MQQRNMQLYYLKIKGGKYVTVRTRRGVKCLYAEDIQDGHARANVKITQMKDSGRILMAFSIQHGKESYSIGFNGTKLKLEKGETEDHSHWFEMINNRNGKFYRLRCVGQKKEERYLSMCGQIFSISSGNQNPVYIKHETEH